MWAELVSDLTFERGQLEKILSDVDAGLHRSPWDEAHTALAALQLHSFYNGAEKCLLWLRKAEGAAPVTSEHWHRELLHEFASDPEFPLAQLRELLAFRHVFRHAYHFELKAPLVQARAEDLVQWGERFLRWLQTRTEAIES